jgi:Phage integrase, N-terminal SAM-like domain
VTSSTRRAEARCRGWFAPAQRSPTPPARICAGSSTTAPRKPSTVRDYQSIINAHLLAALEAKRLEDITTEGVERWAAGLTADGRMNTARSSKSSPSSTASWAARAASGSSRATR